MPATSSRRIFPDANFLLLVLVSGFFSAGIGIVFGLPSLRIKGLYLAVTTLAAQFFLEWCFIRIPWLYNYNASGAIQVSTREAFGVIVAGPAATPTTRYFIVLAIAVVVTLLVKNILRGHIGRSWMMIRDMDIAAELIGVRPLTAKLSAFAVSSYICGRRRSDDGVLLAGRGGAVLLLDPALLPDPVHGDHRRARQPDRLLSRRRLHLDPADRSCAHVLPVSALTIGAETVQHLTFMIVGALIIVFLIAEPHGLARLWQVAKEKLRVWPFPYG